MTNLVILAIWVTTNTVTRTVSVTDGVSIWPSDKSTNFVQVVKHTTIGYVSGTNKVQVAELQEIQ
jgi:hypothetical protein